MAEASAKHPGTIVLSDRNMLVTSILPPSVGDKDGDRFGQLLHGCDELIRLY